MSGPQAYAYANGNPLRYTDPDGRKPGDLFSGNAAADMAAIDALPYAIGLSRFSTYSLPGGGTLKREYGGAVCQCCDTKKAYASKFVSSPDGAVFVDLRNASRLCTREAGDKAIATFHVHPARNPGDTSMSYTPYPDPQDFRNSQSRDLDAYFASSENGDYFKYRGFNIRSYQPGKFDVNRAEGLITGGGADGLLFE